MTGEVDIDEKVESSRRFKYESGTELIRPTTYTSSRVVRKRPATVRVARDKLGFRKPAPFYHEGYKYRIQPKVSERITYDHRWIEVTGVNSRLYTAIPYKPVASLTENECLIKALNRIRDQEVNASVALAESGKSVKMIQNRLASIARSVRRFRRLDPKAFNKVRKIQRGNLPRDRWCEIPSNWLELQYGWIPLMKDIVGTVNEFSREADPLVLYGTGTAEYRGTTDLTLETDLGGWYVTANPRTVLGISQHARCVLVYELEDVDRRNAARLGLTSPQEVVWELLPYSFVVDWALPVGPWLSALQADKGLRFKAGSTGTVREVFSLGLIEGKCRPTNRGSSVSFYTRMDVEGRSFNRTVYEESPLPGLYVKNPISQMHVANGLALLLASFRR